MVSKVEKIYKRLKLLSCIYKIDISYYTFFDMKTDKFNLACSQLASLLIYNKLEEFKLLIHLLLSSGININTGNVNKDTILSEVCRLDIPTDIRGRGIHFLLDKGANPFIHNNDDKTAYFYLCKNNKGKFNNEISRMVSILPAWENTRGE